VKKYEGLFILNTAGKEEGIKEIIDRISDEIGKAGGKVETVQKMDKRPFSRVADKKYTTGFYVNVIFEADPKSVAGLKVRFGLNDEVFRVMFTEAPAPKLEKAA
jgi:ribosomal protein S6